jgi:hypothetical protein
MRLISLNLHLGFGCKASEPGYVGKGPRKSSLFYLTKKTTNLGIRLTGDKVCFLEEHFGF